MEYRSRCDGIWPLFDAPPSHKRERFDGSLGGHLELPAVSSSWRGKQ